MTPKTKRLAQFPLAIIHEGRGETVRKASYAVRSVDHGRSKGSLLPISCSVYRPNSRFERCSYPFFGLGCFSFSACSFSTCCSASVSCPICSRVSSSAISVLRSFEPPGGSIIPSSDEHDAIQRGRTHP